MDDTRCALCECEKCRVRTYKIVPFTAHAAVPYAEMPWTGFEHVPHASS